MEAFKRLLEQYDPKKIAINASADFAFGDGLSMGIYTTWMKELDEKYVDTIIRRWESFTGKKAVHVSTGKTFAEIAAERK